MPAVPVSPSEEDMTTYCIHCIVLSYHMLYLLYRVISVHPRFQKKLGAV